MFWAQPINATAIREHCEATWGVTPRNKWIDTEFAGTGGASNIVFSNGGYDPWSSGGVLESSGDGKIVSVMIPEAAHHLDLFFTHPLDPDSVKVTPLPPDHPSPVGRCCVEGGWAFVPICRPRAPGGEEDGARARCQVDQREETDPHQLGPRQFYHCGPG